MSFLFLHLLFSVLCLVTMFIRAVAVFKGIVHQFWIYNIFFVPQRKKHFLWKVHLDKTTLTRNNWEKWCSKSVRVIYIYNIYNSTRSDWLWAPYFLNYFELELFYRNEPLMKNVSFVETQKNVLNSKLVNNLFKCAKQEPNQKCLPTKRLFLQYTNR